MMFRVVALAMMTASAVTGPAISVTVKARAIAPGEVLLLTIATAGPATGLKVSGLGREFPVLRDGPVSWRVLVGLDLEVKPGPHVLTIESEGSEAAKTTYRLLVKPKAFRTRTLSVDPRFVNPPPEAAARIKSDSERLNRAYASTSAQPLWSGAFIRPVAAAANSAFGTRSVFNGESRNPHSGADFASPAGTPVRAPNAGRVLIAADLYFTGNTIVIDHGLGLLSIFAHLQQIDVRAGDMVVKGQFVGNVGDTGRVTGPHLHWSVRLNDARVDPMSLIAVMGTLPK